VIFRAQAYLAMIVRLFAIAFLFIKEEIRIQFHDCGVFVRSNGFDPARRSGRFARLQRHLHRLGSRPPRTRIATGTFRHSQRRSTRRRSDLAAILQAIAAAMTNRCGGCSRSRLSCRGWRALLVVLLASGTLLVGCTTTHALGRISDPGVRAEVDAIASGGDALLHVRHPPGVRPPPFGDRVTAVLLDGLVIEPTGGQPVLVPREQVAFVSTYHRGRGARDGAIGGGVAGFLVGVALGSLLAAATHSSCSDGCGDNDPDPVALGLTAGAVLGAITALLGAGIGALAGHEDRFELSP
jgi:hypothetical protein